MGSHAQGQGPQTPAEPRRVPRRRGLVGRISGTSVPAGTGAAGLQRPSHGSTTAGAGTCTAHARSRRRGLALPTWAAATCDPALAGCSSTSVHGQHSNSRSVQFTHSRRRCIAGAWRRAPTRGEPRAAAAPAARPPSAWQGGRQPASGTDPVVAERQQQWQSYRQRRPRQRVRQRHRQVQRQQHRQHQQRQRQQRGQAPLGRGPVAAARPRV